MRKYAIWIGLGILAGLLLVAAVVIQRPYTMHGSVVQPPYPAPDFSLPQAQGNRFQLSSQRGRLVMLFFGFTNCKDVCPITLAQMKQVRARLGKDASRVQVVFITVDPDRDTPQKTAAYAAGFDPSFIGLSGNEQQLDPVWQSYGVYHKLDKTSPTDMNYEVEHSSQMYLIDGKGDLRVTYTYGTPADDILQDIRYLLR